MTRMKIGRTAILIVVAVASLIASGGTPAGAFPRKHKHKESAPGNDPTSRLYQTLDESQGGKLNLYMLADVYTDPSHPGQQYQRILYVVYNKDLYFGRLTIHVRSVSKLTPEHLSTYTPEQVFNYAANDTAEFEKIDPGPFGKTGDLYLAATEGHPLAAAPITEDVQQQYDMLLTDYILPSVEKQANAKPQ